MWGAVKKIPKSQRVCPLSMSSDLMKPTAFTDAELTELEERLDDLPAPLEPLDPSMLDGFLCGVLLQPVAVPEPKWLAHVHDVDARPAPAGVALAPLHALVRRRHAELDGAIDARRWFDPWVWELDDEASPSEAVLAWAAGFATALSLFPALLREHEAAILEPLALIYRHLPSEDLQDADQLLAEIDSLEPPADLTDAVEGLVRATLLIADVSRPRRAAPRKSAKPRR
jgi:uncharacterized protein